MTTLREAFAPHLPELNDCHCSTCRRTDRTRYLYGMSQTNTDRNAYWSAISDQLRAATSGTHIRVTWSDHIATLPPANPAPIMDFDMGRDGGQVGIGLGIGSNLHDRKRT